MNRILDILALSTLIALTGCLTDTIAEPEDTDTDDEAIIGSSAFDRRRVLAVLRKTDKPTEHCIYELRWTHGPNGVKDQRGERLTPSALSVQDVAGHGLPIGAFLTVAGITSLPYTAAICVGSAGLGCLALAGTAALVASGAASAAHAVTPAEQALSTDKAYVLRDADYARIRKRIKSARPSSPASVCAAWSHSDTENQEALFRWAATVLK